MPKGIPSLTEIQKSEIIKRVTDKGERVPDLAREYNVTPKTILLLVAKFQFLELLFIINQNFQLKICF